MKIRERVTLTIIGFRTTKEHCILMNRVYDIIQYSSA